MIDSVIRWCLHNRFIVIVVYLALCGWGVFAIYHTPIDAIPDLSENQVIVFADWPGRSPQEIEDQVTYPLSTALQGLPKVKTVRAQSDFGFSMLTVVFEDEVDLYFARTRILERLSSLPFKLPETAKVSMGPDATSLGWVYQYYLDDTKARESGKGLDLGQLRSLQDWFIRYQVNSVPGVSEVAGIGGFVRQYQIDIDPNKLRAVNVPLSQVIKAVEGSNRNVGGGNLEANGREFTVRGLGLVQSIGDLKSIAVGYYQGQPVLLEHVASVQLGPAPRRGVLDFSGREVVGGVVVMRHGESVVDVIERVKIKIAEIQKGLPEGVEIKSFYDQTELIHRAIDTLRITLIEEMILVALVHILFLMHFRSVIIVTLPLPLSILISFILMKEFGMTSNIMSLSGIAIAIGVLVDAAVVVTEAVMREAYKVQEGQVPGLRYPQDMLEIVQRATRLVARPIFFSMAIIIVAFIPVFALSGQEGKLFHPLAFTKSFAMIGATVISMTLIPILALTFIRGKLHDENRNPLMRFLLAVYLPALNLALRFRFWVLGLAVLILVGALWCGSQMGREFMPALNERALLYMPTTLPGVSVPEANRVMAAQDKVLASFPEVEKVVGKLGRADTATDPAPVRMIETTITLRPLAEWREGMTVEKLRSEMMDAMMEYPGFVPTILQPIENRIFMLNSGIRGQVAVKIFGPDLSTLEKVAVQVEKVLKEIPGNDGVFAERIIGSPYLEIAIRREDAARYGVPVAELLDIVETAIGGRELTTTIEGRQRVPVRVRYARDFRDSPERLASVLVQTTRGEQIPLSKVADIRVTTGPAMISSENGLLRVFVQTNVRERDLAGFVEEAKRAVTDKVQLPTGVYLTWGGQYESLIRSQNTLKFLVPVVLFITFMMLYLIYRSAREAAHVLLAVPFALSGGLYLQWILGYNFSVAVWVGYIALFGTAVQTGVVMVIYLEEALKRKELEKGHTMTLLDIRDAVVEGAALRLRPKVMTVTTVVASLSVIMIPIFSSERTGIEIMRPLAVPVIGGMISSLLHILIVTPVIFLMLREWEWRKNQRDQQRAAKGNELV
jgi:Cu(I)/Ag(I) efflux system membrane protein CusA/SilA